MENVKMSPQEFLSVLQKLLEEGIPAKDLMALGSAITTLHPKDWKAVAGNIFVKDLKPLYQSSKKGIKKPSTFFKKFLKTTIQSAKINVPDAKGRLKTFTTKIMDDYNHLSSNEDKGRYILKLSLYAGVFAMAFQKGSKHKMLSRSTLPLIALGVTLVFINRILEEAEKNLETEPGALKLSRDLRSLLRTLNMGFSSGMTFNVMVDGVVDQKIEIHDLNGRTLGSLMPKSVIDTMIYNTLMGLFSTNVAPEPR